MMRPFILNLLLFSSALSADYRPVPVTERFPLGDMQYQGTIAVAESGQADEASKAPVINALVKLPDGLVYRLNVQDTLGRHYGRIIRIEPERLYIAEILRSCWEPDVWKVRMNYLDSTTTLFNPEYRLRTDECIDEDDIAVTEQRLDCGENYCAVQFVLHNRLPHSIDVDYSIRTGFSEKSEDGSEKSTNSGECKGMQRIAANQRVTLKKYLRTQTRPDTVTISPDFGIGEVPSHDRCLNSLN